MSPISVPLPPFRPSFCFFCLSLSFFPRCPYTPLPVSHLPPPTPAGSCEITWMDSSCQVPPTQSFTPFLPERFMASARLLCITPQPWAGSFHYLVIIWGPWHFPSLPPLPSRLTAQGERGERIALGPRCKDTETLPLCRLPSPPAVHIWENPCLRQGKAT